MNLLQSLLYGILAGLADILPVSAQAHRILLLSLLGETTESPLLRLMVHAGTFAALYFSCQTHLTRINRAVKLSKIPRQRRKRPLDSQALMDLEVVKTMMIPVIIGFLFSSSASELGSNLIAVSAFLFINGLILYIPRYLPGSNKDSLTLSRWDALLMGLGGAASILPGISCIGTVSSVGSVRGAEKKYATNIALLLQLPVTLGLVVLDLIGIFTTGIGTFSFMVLLYDILAAAAAFGGVIIGIKVLRWVVENQDIGVFSYYSWGAALFTFILYLNI